MVMIHTKAHFPGQEKQKNSTCDEFNILDVFILTPKKSFFRP